MTGTALVLETALLLGVSCLADFWALPATEQTLWQAHVRNKMRDAYNGKPRTHFIKRAVEKQDISGAIAADLERLRAAGALHITEPPRVVEATQRALDILAAAGEFD